MNIKIAIDVDEVLVPLLKPMAQYKKIALPKKPKYNYLYREVFNCTEERSQERSSRTEKETESSTERARDTGTMLAAVSGGRSRNRVHHPRRLCLLAPALVSAS